MEFYLVVEFDLKTLCHKRDENFDAAVLTEHEAVCCLGDSLAEALVCYASALRESEPTHLLSLENLNAVRVYRTIEDLPTTFKH